MSSWDQIWDKKALPFLDELKSLPDQSTHLSINGFNHDANSQISREDFELYLHNLVLDLNIRPIDYLYEFGCGSGFFIKCLAEYSGATKFGGSDLSENMIAIANNLFPNQDFVRVGAEYFKVATRPSIIVANSVFQYFSDLNHAKRVIENVVGNNPISFAFLDIPRGTLENQYELRSGPHDSNQLRHLLYSENFFKSNIDSSVYDVEIKSQDIRGYSQSKTRFNVFGRKRIESSF